MIEFLESNKRFFFDFSWNVNKFNSATSWLVIVLCSRTISTRPQKALLAKIDKLNVADGEGF